MSTTQKHEQLELAVEVLVNSAWASLLGQHDAMIELRQTCEQEMCRILNDLGLPGRPHLAIVVGPEDGSDETRWIDSVSVGGERCGVPDDAIVHALSYAAGRPLFPPSVLRTLPRWDAMEAPIGDSGSVVRASEVLALVCAEIISRRPDVLFTPEVAAWYCAELGQSGDEMVERALVVLRPVLSLRLALSDHDAVRRVLVMEKSNDEAMTSATEELIATLTEPTIKIHLESGYLRELTLANAENGPEMFPFLREGLFTELGLTLPEFRFVADPSLKARGFAFRINHVITPPLIAPAETDLLVNDTVERLAAFDLTSAVPTSNPATLRTGAFAPVSAEETLEAAGLTTWPGIEYLVLGLAEELRQNAYAIVTRVSVHAMLETLAAAFPDLVRYARASIEVDALTGVLRSLVREQISIRNLPRILTQLISFEVLGNERGALDQMSYVRSGLADMIAHKYARGTGTLVVYLLDPEIEQAVEQLQNKPTDGHAGDALSRRIISAIRAELSYLPENASTPVLLSNVFAREWLATTLANELPRMAVVAYGEIPPRFNVQPVARISWQ